MKRQVGAAVLSFALWAQPADDTRTAEIERARNEKAKSLKPEEVSSAELFLRRFKDEKYLERFGQGFNGLRAKVGNMVTGGGFALGPEYFRNDLLRGRMNLRTSAQASTRQYYKMDGQLTLPHLANDKAWVDVYAVHHNYASINYYGPGPDSTKGGRANYRFEDTSVEMTAAVRPLPSIKLGATIGYLWVNTGPGNDKRFISAERIFTPAQVPGIDRQTNYLRNSVFLQHDTRDNPGGPKAGRNVVFQYTWFNDQKLDAYNFRRLDAEVQQFLPFFNRSHGLGLRAKTTLTDGDRNQSAPFYLQPVLGGSDDLRGFRPFRFSDRNLVVYNAEYRWEVFAGMDAALFADAGKVFGRRGAMNFKDLEGTAGFGLRFNARNATFLRLDVGFSHEGFQVWFKFNDLFAQKAFGAALTQPVF